jgi:hypothetical protein
MSTLWIDKWNLDFVKNETDSVSQEINCSESSNDSSELTEVAQESVDVPIVDSEPSKRLPAPDWYVERIKEMLERTKDHPIRAAMRTAIFLYHDKDITLCHQIFIGQNDVYPAGMFLGVIPTVRGTKGCLLFRDAIDIFPDDARVALAQMLANPHLLLCSIGDYVLTLPKEYFRIVK